MVSDALRLIMLVPDNVGYIMMLMPVARTDLMYQTMSGTKMINQRMYEIILVYYLAHYLTHYVGLLSGRQYVKQKY